MHTAHIGNRALEHKRGIQVEDKRKWVRLNKGLALSFRQVDGFLRSGGRTKDISPGGLCFPLGSYFPVGTLLEIEIHSEDLKFPVKALTRVVWVMQHNTGEFPFEIGVEFVEIPPHQRDMLQTYIKRYPPAGDSSSIQWD